MQSDRRLAAIMFTDMVGYTALGQRNEFLSLALVEEQRRLIRPVLMRHRGREVKTMGDAFLVEFVNALEAVRCAYDIQRATREFNISLGEDKRIHLRVGVHLGDVVESSGDISGDAVNVASRIQSLAEDGGVCVSRQVYDHVHNKFGLRMKSLGTKVLKNVIEPLEVYKIMMPWEEQNLTPSPQLDKRRIAVLPFANISPDPKDEYFADGLTEELISTTSSIAELTLIARTSVMRFKGLTKGIEEVGKELGVGTVVEGSVRKSGNRLRISVQLIDVQSQGHLWAQSYDRDFDDVFAIQTDIAKQVAEALKVQVLPNETRRLEKRPTENMEAYSLYLKGRSLWNERKKESLKEAVGYFEKAIEIDPEYAMAYVGLADCYSVLGDQGILPGSEAFPKARALAAKAIGLDDSVAEAHATLGDVMTAELDWVNAEREFGRAIELNPSYASAHQWYCIYLRVVGRFDDAMAEIKRAHELDPLSPIITFNIGSSYLYERRYDEAIEQFKQLLENDPNFVLAHYYLGIAYAFKAMFEEAISEIQTARALSSAAHLSSFLAYTLAKSGAKEDAVKVVKELVERSRTEYVSPFDISTAYVAIDLDKAFEWLEKAYDVRDGPLIYLNEVGFYDSVRSDPRYVALLKKMRLEQ